MIELDLPSVTPIQIARQCYIKWKMPPFYAELNDYLERGHIVISRPDIFAMAKVDSDTLVVRMAVGELRTLLCALPVLTPWISFHRRNKGDIKKYSLAKLLNTTGKIIKQNEGTNR